MVTRILYAEKMFLSCMDEYGAQCGHTHGFLHPADLERHSGMHAHASTTQHAQAHAKTESASGQKRTTYLVIDSRDRDPRRHPSPANYVVQLPATLYNVSCARLLSAELPTSFYVFSAARGNTAMTVVLDGVTKTVTIPDGNYGFTTLTTATEQALLTAFGTPFAVTISPTTLRCTIAVASGTVGVDTRSLGSTAATQWGLAYYLGFDRDILVQGTGTVTSPRVANTSPENYLLLHIDELGTLMEGSADGVGGHTSRNLFAKVPITVGSAQVAFYDKVITSNEQNPLVAKLSSLHIRWTFHDGTPVDFQGLDNSITLDVEYEATRSNQ